jgi:hypothetical protein
MDTENPVPEPWPLTPPPAVPLTGTEALKGTSRMVRDFWRWAYSDLRMNVTRGIFAEYLVAQAVGGPRPVRNAWDDYDVQVTDGTTVEVKSAAYLPLPWHLPGPTQLGEAGPRILARHDRRR